MTKKIPRMNTILKAIQSESVLEKKPLDTLLSPRPALLFFLLDSAKSPYRLASLFPGKDSQNKLSTMEAKNAITKGMSNAKCQSFPPSKNRINQKLPISRTKTPAGQKNLEPGRPVSCSRRTPTAKVGKNRAS